MLLALGACGTEPFVPTPTDVFVSPASLTFHGLGTSQQVRAVVLDQKGDTMRDAGVTWLSLAPAVASVDLAGRITSTGVGAGVIKVSSATNPNLGTIVMVSVAQVPAFFRRVEGDGQSATVGTATTVPLSVSLRDSGGAAIPGAVVTFAVTQGGGTTAAADTTDFSGLASTVWRLGTVAGPNTVQATLNGSALPPLTFTATALAGAPAAMTVQAGNNDTAHAGTLAPVPPQAHLHDAFGNPVPGVKVAFTVTAGGGVLAYVSVATDSNGNAADPWTLGAAGTNSVEAAVALSNVTGNPETFTATAIAAGAPARAVAAAADGQIGLIGYAVNYPPAVLILDSANGPVAGVPVTFAVTSGGGSLTGSSTTTNDFGVATAGSWTVQAGSNTVTATAAGAGISGNPVQVSASGVTSGYHIDLRYLSLVAPSQQAAFDSAAARWERLIIGDVPDIPNVTVAAGQCGTNSPAITNETIDDVVIFVTIDQIDGPGGILGGAGPCFVRSTGLSLIGLMHFDVADIAALDTTGALAAVVMHEMGHVLGFGTMWGPPPGVSLLVSPRASGATDPHFVGTQALVQFDAHGGAGYGAGAKVPVENCIGYPLGSCGLGTYDSHWRETIFDNELMTGFLNSGVNPISAVTAAAMGDLGYIVNYAASDPYSVVNPLAALRSTEGVRIELRDDRAKVPIYVVDAAGRVVGVVAPPR